jgi:hypothetical protein
MEENGQQNRKSKKKKTPKIYNKKEGNSFCFSRSARKFHSIKKLIVEITIIMPTQKVTT